MRRAPTENINDIVNHDRQILVVGRDLAGFAAVGFLERAGLSPVLVDGPADRLGSGVVPIWRSGLELLEQIGIRRSVEATGTSLSALGRVDPSRPWNEAPPSRPSLVAVPGERLGVLFDRQLSDRVRTIDRAVESINSIERGVRVSFEHGVTEIFDAVVTTDRTLVTPHSETERSASVHWWAFDWPSSVTAPDVPIEAWGEDFAAFTIPTSERVRVFLVAERDSSPGTPLSLERLAEQFGGLISGLEASVAELDESAIQYARIPHSVPVDWAVDNVALIGRPTHASVPGDCLGPALTIEDSWVLADSLAYGPTCVADALTAYVDRRRRRLATIETMVRSDGVDRQVPATLSGTMRQLCMRRSLTFGRLLDSGVSDIARNVTERL